jgi:hypothetical protein
MKKQLVAALVLSVLAVPAFAQSGPARRGHDGAMFARMCADGDARIASRLAFVEAKIKPTQAQRAAWDSFARDARAAAEPMKRLCEGPAPAAATNDAAAELARRERLMTAMLDGIKMFRPAVERLQVALDDTQKEKLAEALNPRGHRGPQGHSGPHARP